MFTSVALLKFQTSEKTTVSTAVSEKAIKNVTDTASIKMKFCIVAESVTLLVSVPLFYKVAKTIITVIMFFVILLKPSKLNFPTVL